jgi:hypothetical protein
MNPLRVYRGLAGDRRNVARCSNDMAKQIASLFLRPRNAFCKVKHLFVFSHMRSRSSLLSHILGSNSGVCGYSELHQNYKDRSNLLALRARLSFEHQCSLKDKYLLDKLLFNRRVSDAVLKNSKSKVIFLLRKPNDSIRSLMKMGHSTRIEWHRDPEAICRYYCASMLWLQGYAERLRGDFFFLESDDLIDRTQCVLEELTDWLGLDEPLSERYSIFENTGKAWHGDPSCNIRSGIVKKTIEHTEIKIPEYLIDQAELSYLVCKDRLRRCSIHNLSSNPKPL